MNQDKVFTLADFQKFGAQGGRKGGKSTSRRKRKAVLANLDAANAALQRRHAAAQRRQS